MISPTTIVGDHSASQSCEVDINDKTIYTTVTSSGEIADWWIQKIKYKYDTTGYRLIVGLDMELINLRQRIATLQFSAGGECLIYRMSYPLLLPDPLKQFLLDHENNVFVGVGLRKKLRLLRRQAAITDYVPYLELCNLAAYSYSASKLNGSGLVQLADVVLSLNLVRPEVLRRWNATVLSDPEVEYACIGAYIALQIGLVLTTPMPKPKLATHSESQSELGHQWQPEMDPMATGNGPKVDIKDPGGQKYFNVVIFGKPVFTILTKDPEFVTWWIRQIVNSKRDKLVVGLDIHLVNSRRLPATIQFCIDGRCLIYHMHPTSLLPRSLQQFITDPNNIFVGVRLEYKLSVLKYKTNFAGIIPYANLGHLAAFHCNRQELLDAEMSELALNVLGKKLVMPEVDADWDQPELLDEQVMYACIGAYVSYELGRETVVI